MMDENQDNTCNTKNPLAGLVFEVFDNNYKKIGTAHFRCEKSIGRDSFRENIEVKSVLSEIKLVGLVTKP